MIRQEAPSKGRGLAARAGISQGLLYYYFADKHAVFAALMQEGVRSDAAPSRSSLGRLLKQAFAGPTRDLAFEEPPDADADWTVVTRPFTLRRPF